MDKLTELAGAIEGRLCEFGAIDLREENGCGIASDRPYFPKLYLSGKKDKSLMSLPGEGLAVVGYKVQRRTIDESRDDGEPRYGADIEIQSIEPYEGEPEEFAAVEDTLFLHEFAGERDRDDAGRFSAGQVAKPGDFALAHQAQPTVNINVRERKSRLGTGMVLGAAGTLALQRRKQIAALLKG